MVSERRAIKDGMDETPFCFQCLVVVKVLLIWDAKILKSNITKSLRSAYTAYFGPGQLPVMLINQHRRHEGCLPLDM